MKELNPAMPVALTLLLALMPLHACSGESNATSNHEDEDQGGEMLDLARGEDATPDEGVQDMGKEEDAAAVTDMERDQGDGDADMTMACTPPRLPGGDGSLVLGVAGAPVSLFGPEADPTFEAAYTSLSESGFNSYMPIFITSEVDGVAKGTQHFSYFLPSSMSGEPAARSCDGNPGGYAAMKGKIEMIFPGFLLLPPGAGDMPVSEDAIRRNINMMRQSCWGEHEAVIGAIQSYDEPALFSVINGFVGEPALLMANVTTASKVFREEFPALPISVVEGPLPLLIEAEPSLTADQRDMLSQEFWQKTQIAAEASDWYGFDVYPVPDLALTLPGDYVRDVKRRFSPEHTMSVLQGFSPSSVSDGADMRRGPNKKETWFMLFDSIVAGADVLFWWGASTLDLSQPADAEQWQDLTQAVAVARQIAPALELPPRELPGDAQGVSVLATTNDGVSYVILVNRSSEPKTWRAPDGESLFDMLSGEPLMSTEVTLDAHDVVLLMLKVC